MAPASKEDRLFVKNGRRHYRPRYSLTEVRFGVVIVLALGAIFGWVIWKGQHPDPSLFAVSDGLVWRGVEGVAVVDRGPVPADLAPEGWTERSFSAFGPDTLYKKINGREGYYKSFGFQRLYFLAMEGPGGQATIDVEVYDLGAATNALGAYGGELSESAEPSFEAGGFYHFARNALFLTRGALYVRAIGSDESDATLDALQRLGKQLREEIQGAGLPWGYVFLAEVTNAGPGALSYAPENALSFGFAKDVYIATLQDGETEIFVTYRPSAEQAQSLRADFETGFMNYGAKEHARGRVFIRDRYLGRVSVVAEGRGFVFGVRSAENVEAAAGVLTKLQAGIEMQPLPADAPKSEDGDGGSEPEPAPKAPPPEERYE